MREGLLSLASLRARNDGKLNSSGAAKEDAEAVFRLESYITGPRGERGI